MDFSTINLDALVPKLEARRVALNLSYQNVADACNVSQSTIIRIFKRQADPSIVVALHPEGVDRNKESLIVAKKSTLSPSTRRAWIEIRELDRG